MGSRFAKMEHYEVADMFGRRTPPILKITGGLEAVPTARELSLSANLHLYNIGRGSARAPYVEVSNHYHVNAEGSGLRGQPGDSLMRFVSTRADGQGMRGIGYGDFIIHPGTRYHVVRINLSDHWGVNQPPPPLVINGRAAAENYPLTESSSSSALKSCTLS